MSIWGKWKNEEKHLGEREKVARWPLERMGQEKQLAYGPSV